MSHSLISSSVRLGVLSQQRRGGDDLARGADAALKAAAVDEGLLQRAELLRRAETFDCRDLGAVGLDGEGQTGGNDATVQRDGAGAADADAASLLGAVRPRS